MADKIIHGKDFNFFRKVAVSGSTFPESSDLDFAYKLQTLILLNEGTTSSQVVEYSFNGNTIHGELDPSLPSRGLVFDNRNVVAMWFRIKAGSAGPVNVSVTAWGAQ